MPLFAAFAIVETAFTSASFASSLFFAATAVSTFLIDVFTADLMDLFLAVFVAVTRILFFADLMFANLDTSICDCYVIIVFESSSNPDTDVPMYIAISFYVKNLYLSIHIFLNFAKNKEN